MMIPYRKANKKWHYDQEDPADLLKHKEFSGGILRNRFPF